MAYEEVVMGLIDRAVRKMATLPLMWAPEPFWVSHRDGRPAVVACQFCGGVAEIKPWGAGYEGAPKRHWLLTHPHNTCSFREYSVVM